MKKAFTLIELLVVLVVLIVIMGLVVPSGYKMFKGFESTLNNIKSQQNFFIQVSNSFISLEEQNATLFNTNYSISSKGIVQKNEKSNNHN